MDNEKTIDVLNSLIIINNDRIDGYETAAEETEEHYLRTLFAQFSATSRKCKQELINEVSNLGGEAAEGTMTSGKLFRVWMDVKAAITGKNSKAILNSCEYGEDIALGIYKDVLENEVEHLNTKQLNMINIQRLLIKIDRNTIKSMHDVLAEV